MDRYQLITSLLMNADQVNESYISGNTDEATWIKNLLDVNHKLNVLGLEMLFRPWESKNNMPGF